MRPGYRKFRKILGSQNVKRPGDQDIERIGENEKIKKLERLAHINCVSIIALFAATSIILDVCNLKHTLLLPSVILSA